MANIPFAQIPNAPQGVGDPRMPVGAAGRLEVATMPVLDQSVFGLGGQALAALGQSAGDLGRGAMAWSIFARKTAEATDDFNFARADRLWSEARSDHQVRAATADPAEHLRMWQEEYLPRLQEETQKIPFSEKGRQRFAAWEEVQMGNSYAQIQSSSYKAFLDRGRHEIMNAVDRSLESGDYEAAAGHFARGRANGYMTPQEEEAGLLKIEQQVKWDTIEQILSTDPYTSASKLQKAVEDNREHPDFPQLKTQADRVKALRAARGFERESLSRYSGEALERVLQGEFQTKDQIREAYTGLLPEKEIQALESTLDQTPEAIQQRIELYQPVLALIEAYDPSTDPNLDQRMQIRMAIRQVESGFQRDLVDQLNEKVRQNRPQPPTAVNLISKELERRLKAGDYGTWETSKDGNPSNPDEQAKYEAAMLYYGQEATAFREWSRRNPGATDAEAWNEINRIRVEQYKLNKAAGRDLPSPANLEAPTAEEIRSRLGAPEPGASSRGRRRQPAAVRHNNPGAQYPGPIATRFGSTRSATIGGGHKIATFDDPVQGGAAQIALLRESRHYRGKPLRDAIKTWSGGNSVASYLASIKRDTGLSGDTVLSREFLNDPEKVIPLVKAMAKHETGRPFPMTDEQWLAAFQMALSS